VHVLTINVSSILLKYNQQVALVSQVIYSCKTLYMFRTVFPSIIRSSKLHIRQQTYVKQLLLYITIIYYDERTYERQMYHPSYRTLCNTVNDTYQMNF